MTTVKAGISKTIFVVGIIAAILASSLISVIAVTQLSATLGLKGEKGDKGDTGATGATGATGIAGAIGLRGPAGILNADYDSGWELVNGRIVVQFSHNLNASDVFVYLLCKWYRNWTGSGGPMVHQFYYGGDSYGDPQQTQGFYWDCYTQNPNIIEVSQFGGRADEIRVLIWKLPKP